MPDSEKIILAQSGGAVLYRYREIAAFLVDLPLAGGGTTTRKVSREAAVEWARRLQATAEGRSLFNLPTESAPERAICDGSSVRFIIPGGVQ
jgi:hypothetical protein